MSDKQFFSYDPSGFGIQFHDNEEDAKSACEKAFDEERDNSPEGWGDDVTDICWGVVHEKVNETTRRELGKDEAKSKGYDIEVDYKLEDFR